MGEAKRRAIQRQKWLASLTDDERIIWEASERLFSRFIVPSGATGMCYRMTFFLHLYLTEKGVNTTPVVGYINDGTDDVQISHAWLEYGGRKVDLTLAQVENPDASMQGQVVILDQVFKNGHPYSYERKKNERAVAVEEHIAASSTMGAKVVASKAREHAEMTARAENAEAMKAFLDAAPDRLTYQVIASIIDA